MSDQSLSIFGVLRIFRSTAKHLCNVYQVSFNAENFDETLQALIAALKEKQMNVWNTLFQSFKVLVKQRLSNVFVQENKHEKLAMISVLGFPSKQSRDYKQHRGVLFGSNHKTSTVLFDLLNNKIVGSFDNKPIPYRNTEAKMCISKIKELHNTSKVIKMTKIPLGVQVQLAYHDGDWLLFTRNVLRLNESTLIGTTPLMEKLTSMLGEYNVSVDDLDKSTQYTFCMCSQEYSVVPSVNKLYLMSVFKPNSKPEPSKIDALPRLPTTAFKNVPNLQDVYLWIHEFTNQFPLYSLQFKFNQHVEGVKEPLKRTFELVSSLGEVIEYVRENDRTAEQQKEALVEFAKENPTNRYIQWSEKNKEQ